MSIFADLLAHPGWRQLEDTFRLERDVAMQRLLALARASTDAAVRAEATKIEQIRVMLERPREEAKKGAE